MGSIRLLSLAAAATVDAFHLPPPRLPPSKILLNPNDSSNDVRQRCIRNIHFSSPINDSSDILDSDLAAEIDAALLLAQQAIEGSTEEGLDAIADLLLEEPVRRAPSPPKDAPPMPLTTSIAPTPPPPAIDPESEDATEEEEETQPELPPTPPSPISFGRQSCRMSQ